MKNLFIVVAFAVAISGCGKQETPVAEASAPAKIMPPAPVKKHHYSLRDGYEYGYERAISNEDRNKGQAASALTMAKYAGQQDGKYQVYIKNPEAPGAIVVAECTNPCEFLKSMVFYQGSLVSSERMRVAPGVIGWMMLEDAINGELEQFVTEKNNRKGTVWFDEKKGLIITPLVETKPPLKK